MAEGEADVTLEATKTVAPIGASAIAGPAAGAAVGGLVNIGGGILSHFMNQKSSDKAWERQKEALQNTVSWRVADAKRAGIHPLYALGQAPMTSSPMAFEDTIGPALRGMGSDVGNVISQTATQQQKYDQRFQAWKEAQDWEQQRKKTDAEIQVLTSQASRNDREARNIAPPGLGIHDVSGNDPGSHGQELVDIKAAEQLTTRQNAQWSSAGKNPAYQLRMLDENLPMYLPIAEGDSPEETIQEMSFPTWAGLLQRNARIFGPGWMKDMLQSRYLGLKPEGKYDTKAGRKFYKR